MKFDNKLLFVMISFSILLSNNVNASTEGNVVRESLFEGENTSSNYFYLGAKTGLSVYQDGCNKDAIDCKDNVAMFGVYGGYQTTDWLSLEVGYASYGKPKAYYQHEKISADIHGLEIAAKIKGPLAKNVDLFSKFGAVYQSIDKRTSYSTDSKSKELSFLGSLGVDYYLSKNWSITGEYQFIDGVGNQYLRKADLHVFSFGVTYHFRNDVVDIQVKEEEPRVLDLLPNKAKRNLPRNAVNEFQSSSIFEFNSSRLKDTKLLEPLAHQLNHESIGSIHITGHTDSVGSELYNLHLSERRANAVAQYFISKGVDRDRIKTFGRGELEPLASNETAAGRAENRRVSVAFTRVLND